MKKLIRGLLEIIFFINLLALGFQLIAMQTYGINYKMTYEIATNIGTAFLIVLALIASCSLFLFLKNRYHITTNKDKMIYDAKELILNSNIAIKYKDYINTLDNIKISPILSSILEGYVNPQQLDKVFINIINPLSIFRKRIVSVVAHEMVHILQYAYYSDMESMYKFFITKKKIGYWNNPLEVEARSVEVRTIEQNRLEKLINAQNMIFEYRNKE
jgi:hypothetical protein